MTIVLPRDAKTMKAKFEWLEEYRDSIHQWELLSLRGRQVLSEVRRHGYGTTTVEAVWRVAESIVRTALATCRIASLRSWIKRKFGNSLRYTRSLDLTPTPAEQNLRKPKPVAIPVF